MRKRELFARIPVVAALGITSQLGQNHSFVAFRRSESCRYRFAIEADLVSIYNTSPGGFEYANNNKRVCAWEPEQMGAEKVKTYRPTDKEPFMNERQRDYFRQKLLAWKEDILREAKETLQHLQDENQNHPDFADRASSETDRAIELRARDRQRKLIAKIDDALTRIDDGTYGYCEETGEPISIKRLEARPIATLSIEAQERHERRERVYRDE
jgi:DnaK suppressor protein